MEMFSDFRRMLQVFKFGARPCRCYQIESGIKSNVF
jgi:hypothetical protein